jgi:anti-sigma factor RsiW
MKSNCITRDYALFLHATSEDSFLARLRTTAHVRHCPACQARLDDYLAAAGLFAEHLPPVGPPSAPLPPPSHTPWLTRGALVLLGGVIVWMSGIWVSHALAHPAIPAKLAATPDDACRPGLPSDKCR